MIANKETNYLYLADTLPKKYPAFCERFEKLLIECSVNYSFLTGTNDVWAVDYMPLQVRGDYFVQFKYYPDYLKPKKYRDTISDVETICKKLGIKPQKSDIVLDGGNITRWMDTVILCDKIFRENTEIHPDKLIETLHDLLEVEHIYFVPEDPSDFTGHADGMIRFLNPDTVLINDYSKESKKFRSAFLKSIDDMGFNFIEIPYCPNTNSKYSAKGLYLNYLEMDGLIIVPTFGIKEDEQAVKQLENIFKGSTVKAIESNELAADGGIINCITWNIKKDTHSDFDLHIPWEGGNYYNQL